MLHVDTLARLDASSVLVRITRPASILVLSSVLLGRVLPASSHPAIGAPSAYPIEPSSVGTVVSSTFTLTWLDYDRPIPTGTATIDWYYATQNPKTYLIGATPEDLEGELIVGGIAESDTANRHVWDVSNVPSGSYFVWSKVTEPPEENPLLQLYSFSQGVLTVHHAGDPVHPAVCFNKPDNPFTLVDEELPLVLEAFDPDGTGRLTLELFSRDTPEVMIPVFADRPSAPRIEEPLDTRELEEGDYGMRLSLIDGRGLGFAAYSRWFFRVSHRLVEADAGTREAGSDAGLPDRDAGIVGDAGAADGGTEVDPDGCACAEVPRSRVVPSHFALVLLLFGLGFGRRLSDARRHRLR